MDQSVKELYRQKNWIVISTIILIRDIGEKYKKT